MLQSRIRKLFFFFIASVFTLSVKAQKSHFIYLQTDNGLPFYTKFNGKLISSSSEGYAILSGVVDGDYKLTVGFPKNELPEETFNIKVENNNEGFLLKNFDDKGLQLFNLQTLALIEPASNNTVAVGAKKDEDAFSVALAGVVKDSSILQNHENIAATPATKTDATAFVNDSSKTKNNVSIVGNAVSSTVSDSGSKENPSITKISDVQNKEGSQMIYADKNSAGTDTINVIMPAKKIQEDSNSEKNIVAQNAAEKSAVPIKQDSSVNNITAASTSNTISSANNSEVKTDTAANDAENTVKKTSETHVIVLPNEISSSRTNSDCKNFATDADFLKLRGKMAEESESDKMIRVAKKYFQKKCYSTAQVRNLSYIFLTNEGKYQFFEAAYPFVSDSNLYPTLENQFTDPYYLNRFKALVGQ